MSYWYGFDVGSIPRSRKLGLLANLPRLHAQRAIREHRFDPTDPDGVHDLYLTAYGSTELAQRMCLQAAKHLVRRETEMARKLK